MKSLLIRTIAGWLVLSVLVIPGIILPAAYLTKHLGSSYVQDLTGIARAQAAELLLILVSQSEGERSPERMVQLSSTMAALEERTMHQTQGIVAIREIALIDTKGRVLAHNDVTQIAKDTPSRFQEEKYTKIAQRTRRDSIAVLPLEPYQPALPANAAGKRIAEFVLPSMKVMFPDLFVAAYEATAAVYPVDGEIPSGGIVMIVENRAPLRVFGLIGSLLSPAAFVMGAVALVLVLYLPVLALVAQRKKTPAPAISEEVIPSVEAVPSAHAEGDDSDFHAPEMPSVDFGEVPLPDFIQNDSLQQYAAAAAPHTYSSSSSGARPALDEILDAIPVEPD
jgi:hypothetical protein